MEFPISKDLNFTENWINSIGKEVLRGVKVRDEKLKSHQSNSSYQYDVVDIDFTKPSCSKSQGSSQLQRTLGSRKNVKSHRSVSPQKRKKRYRKCKKNKRNNGKKTCGMRIAELAEPSKRHCFETWRSRWDTLPALMVDRLRQIVMDQKPIVPIKDAIICFKQKKTNISRSPYKGHKTVESKKTNEIKVLCGIFGFRISSKLQAPRNVTLASQLTPIAHVINDEISQLLVKRKKTNLQKNIQIEIANKITNWIADILEQSTYNLMLEDFTELEKEEGHIWDIIDELVDNVALLCKDLSSSSSDVIETESSDSDPSLKIEETESEHSHENNLDEFKNIISNLIEKIPSDDIKTQDRDTTSLENLDDTEEYSLKTAPESIEDYFRNFLSNHIDEIILNDEEVFEDAMLFDSSNSSPIDNAILNNKVENTIQNTVDKNSHEKINEINNDSNKSNDLNEDIGNNEDTNDPLKNEVVEDSSRDNNEDILTKDSLKNEAIEDLGNIDNNSNSSDIMKHNFTPEPIPNDSSEKIKIKDSINSLPEDQEDTFEVIMDNAINNDNNTIEETNLTSDETIPLTDITSEDSIKKVKYSTMDSGQGKLNIKSNMRDGENKKSGIQGIHFAPPNDHLLSDADESWPENSRFPTVKATVSISKSVLSLGKINEDEEKNRDPDSGNEDDTKASYIENDEESKRNIDNQNTLLKINSSNEEIINKKLDNIDSRPVIEAVIETSKVEKDKEGQKYIDPNMVLLNSNGSNENIGNKNPLSVIKDVIDTHNIELNREVQEIDDKNLTKTDSYVNEDILNTNNVEKAGEYIQKNIDEVLSENKVQVAGKHLLDISNSQEVGDGPDDIKNKAVQTTNKIYKRGPLNLSVKHLPVILICPEIYTQNIQYLGKAKKDETTQIQPYENRQYTQSEVRIWCQGLQNVVQNLDLWLDWIDNTCTNLLHLKQKEKIKCNRKIQEYSNRKWIMLKTNIDSDARLWEKLSIALQVGLKSYQCFYQQPETQPTRPCKNHQHQRREQPHQMEKICTCKWAHHGPLNPRVLHL